MGVICQYCRRVAYWYEVKVEKQKPKEYACCEKAKTIGLSIHTKIIKEHKHGMGKLSTTGA